MKQILLIPILGLFTMTGALPALAQNVGVGTTTPTQKLDVNGNLRVRGLSGTDNRLPIVQPDGTLGVSQPISPVTVLSSPVNLGNLSVSAPAGVAVSGNYLYVTHTSPNELLVFDITNPTTPVAVPSGTVAGGTYLDLLTVSGGYVYVCDINADNIRVYSLLPGTTPAGSTTAPAYLGTFATEDQPNGAVVVGTNLYIADYGTAHIQVFNLTGAGGSVTAPPLLGTFSTGSGPSGLAVSPDNRYLYVTNYAANRLQVFDLNASATAPTLVTTLTPGTQPNAVAVANNLLYLTNAGSNTLYTYGLSTPGTPVYQSSTPTAGQPYGFDVKGNYAYLTNVTSNQLRVLQLTQSNSVGFNSSGQLTSVPNSALGDNLGNGVAATNVNLNGNLLVGGTLGSPGTTGLFVSSAGNVGINTSTPAQKLDVNGIMQLSTGDVDKIYLTTQGAAGSKIGHLANWGVASYAGPGNAAVGFHTWSISAVAGYVEKMRLTANGYLGLGTTTPFSQLANTSNNIIGPDGNGGNPGTLTWEANQAGYVGGFYNGGTTANSHGLVVKVAGTTAAALDVSQNAAVGTAGNSLLRVRADGNVGLGTLSPSARLHVAGTAGTSNVRLESLGGTGTRLVSADASGNLSATATLPDGTTFIQNQNAADQTGTFRITGNGLIGGNVGIGSTAIPGARLDVANGNVRVAAANDYTYASAKTYSLMLGASDFQAENGTTARTLDGGTDEMYPTNGSNPVFRAPLHLPQGAVITGITLLAYDGATPSNLSTELVSYAATGNGARTSIVTVATAGSPNYTSVASGTLATTVDNDSNTYSLRATFGVVNSVALTLRGVKVTYTVLRAQ